MPTGIALRDVREQLFDAAERILLRDGANALTSRAVTTEAGVAKGVLHRHFEDFDAFLAELVLDRIGRIEDRSRALRESAGTGAVLDNLTAVLTELFGTIALRIVGLVIARDALRARLREARGGECRCCGRPRRWWPATSPRSATWGASRPTPRWTCSPPR